MLKVQLFARTNVPNCLLIHFYLLISRFEYRAKKKRYPENPLENGIGQRDLRIGELRFRAMVRSELDTVRVPLINWEETCP